MKTGISVCRMKFKAFAILAIAFSFCCSTPLLAANKKPSVLIYTQGPKFVSFPMLKYMSTRAGFNVDYTGDVKRAVVPLTWKKVEKYNCVVLLLHEQDSKAGNLSAGNVKILKRFVEAGGGLFLLPDLVHWDTADHFLKWDETWGRVFGARFLFKQAIFEKDKSKTAHGGYFDYRYLLTSNINRHEVTKGISKIWYQVFVDSIPRSQKQFSTRDIRTYPLFLDDKWKVLVSGSPTSHSESVIKTDIKTESGLMESTKEYSSAPPLFAVRNFGKGRLAFEATNAENHFIAGMHHATGGDMEEMKGGFALEKGFNGKSSDSLKLIVNTINWLSEPSLKSGALGGSEQDPSRLCEPHAPPTRLIDWKAQEFLENKPPLPLFKGLIGAKTNLSGGEGGVADYKRAALKSDLDYLVFLEDFANLTEGKLEKLKKECAELSDDKILLIPGYRARDNRGNRMFIFGVRDLPWPEKKYLTSDGKAFDMSARKDSSGLPHIEFCCDRIIGKNALGYFDLHASKISRVWNLKLYHAIGLLYYDNGKMVEGLKENLKSFLEVNNAGCNIQPYAITLVSSPEKMTAALSANEYLTYVRAKDLKAITTEFGGLSYNYLVNPFVFVSDGPLITDWSCFNRDCVVHAENFVTPNYRFDVNLAVDAANGLKEIKIYDGLDSYMRISPNGAKQFKKTLHLNHDKQKNLILEITDDKGRKAISAEQFDRNHMHMHYWCSDRINGNLKHGPLYFFGSYGESGIDFVSKGVDSFKLFAAAMKLGCPKANLFVSSKGEFDNRRLANRPLQGMISEDAGIYHNNCCMYFPESEKLWSVWGTYGPLLKTTLYDYFQTFVEFRNHFARADAYIPSLSGIPNSGDVVPGLNIEEYRFKVAQKIESLPVASFRYGKYGNIKGNKMIVSLCRSPKDLPIVFDMSNRSLYEKRLKKLLNDKANPFKIERGGYFAVFGSKSGAATRIGYNVSDIAFIPKAICGGIAIFADVAGRLVKPGDVITIKTLGISGKVPKFVNSARYDAIGEYLGISGKPGYDIRMSRGSVLPVSVGFCDLKADKGVVALELSNRKNSPNVVLPVRVFGLNDKWSAYCYDKSAKLARPIGVYHGVGYARFDPFYVPKTKVAIGHPLTADNQDIVIIATIMADGKYPLRKDMKPGKWKYSLYLNNPTKKTIKTTLFNNMKLPDFPFEKKTVTLKPGEFLDLSE